MPYTRSGNSGFLKNLRPDTRNQLQNFLEFRQPLRALPAFFFKNLSDMPKSV